MKTVFRRKLPPPPTLYWEDIARHRDKVMGAYYRDRAAPIYLQWAVTYTMNTDAVNRVIDGGYCLDSRVPDPTGSVQRFGPGELFFGKRRNVGPGDFHIQWDLMHMDFTELEVRIVAQAIDAAAQEAVEGVPITIMLGSYAMMAPRKIERVVKRNVGMGRGRDKAQWKQEKKWYSRK